MRGELEPAEAPLTGHAPVRCLLFDGSFFRQGLMAAPHLTRLFEQNGLISWIESYSNGSNISSKEIANCHDQALIRGFSTPFTIQIHDRSGKFEWIPHEAPINSNTLK